ncbi:MAG: L-serine ammonia-lyase, iron-sulfur-dependent, subunit alpha [Prevotellaceae bacterium]|nr:L-serine ammonia-lyase, iron-sulfur-dependent, subunit alpha [Prevotella sp.]MDD7257829.1 L-serine ammonia-lyase, iron-sulfur-dependent, subunit alpha [Prevotellaceae bacterium]MDY6131562.1 L-serine ammonia-lyase, iron-sulfur-dependent, subunit alpha [Prevotella sp.]
MFSDEEKKSIIDLIKRQVVPAIGCTEPIAVALCVAKATELLGRRPESIELRLSANILKNAMGVGIPGTGMIGLPIAIALGALVGKSEYGLEVLRDSNLQAVEEGKAYIAENRIKIDLEKEDEDKLYINVVCKADGHEAEARIKTHHTDFVYFRKDGEEMAADRQSCEETATVADNGPMLTLRKVYDFATETDLDDLRFILEAKRLNKAVAENGLKDNYGHQVGKTISSPLGRGIMGDGIYAKVLSATTGACDARMAGAMMPVMSNSGSGNQGICATMPVVVFSEENHNSEEELIRALIISNLTAIYIKQNLGALSALCGCVVASTGSSCGITYLMGGTYEQISYSVKNMIANLTGMICDGAKPSCALKLTTGVGTAVMSAMLAMSHKYVTSVEGIIDDDVDQSIRNLTAIGSKGMDETDRYVLDIMTHKTVKKVETT